MNIMNTGGGDIWSTGAFAFESPLKDLLETGSYTVQDLLGEDELLQELRGRHPQLVNFLSTEESVATLVQLLISTPDNDDTIKREEEEEEKELGYDEDDGGDTNSNADMEMQTVSMEENQEEMSTDHTSEVTPSSDPEQVENTDTSNSTDTTTTTAMTATTTTTTNESTNNWLVENTTEPASPRKEPTNDLKSQEEFDRQYLRYPYMACEVFCCEVPQILDILVTGYVPKHFNTTATTATSIVNEERDNTNDDDDDDKDDDNHGQPTNESQHKTEQTNNNTTPSSQQSIEQEKPQSILDLLFTLLTNTKSKQLDDRRAGYLEKILIILFRMKKTEMAAYINGDHLETTNNHHHHHNNYMNETNGNSVTDTTCHQGGGLPLLQSLFSHLSSHSITQIVQRLLLPRPNNNTKSQTIEGGRGNGGGGSSENDNDNSDPNNELDSLEDNALDDDNDTLITAVGDLGYIKSKWADNEVALELLLRQLLDSNPQEQQQQQLQHAADDKDNEQEMDQYQHASEILISIIQNSPLTSNIMRIMTSDDVITRLVSNPLGNLIDEESLPSDFTYHESTMTIYMSVLESLVLQLGGYGAVPTATNHNIKGSGSNHQLSNGLNGASSNTASDNEGTTATTENDNNNNSQEKLMMTGGLTIELGSAVTTDTCSLTPRKAKIHHSPLPNEAKSTAITQYLPQLLTNLSKLLTHSNTTTWTSPVQYSTEPQQRLGTSRLRIVRLLESLVLLGHPDVDHILSQSDCLEVCLDLFWQFSWCSMLHQSVANLLVHVLEGGVDRLELQRYFLYRCDLPKRLMESFVGTCSSDVQQVVADEEEVGLGTVDPGTSNVTMDDETKQEEDALCDPIAMNGSDDSLDDVIAVSDDDIDAIMEQEDHIMEVQKELNQDEPNTTIGEDEEEGKALDTAFPSVEESTDVTLSMSAEEEQTATTSADLFEEMEKHSLTAIPIDSTVAATSLAEKTDHSNNVVFRVGFMGHIIIICQALVHASALSNEDETNNKQKLDDLDTLESGGPTTSQSPTSGDMPMVDVSQSGKDTTSTSNLDDMQMLNQAPSDEMQELSIPSPTNKQERIVDLLQKHHLYHSWRSFISTTLKSETAIQSTPLGGQGLSNEESAMVVQHLQNNTISAEETDEIDVVLEDNDDEEHAGGGGGFIHGGEAIDLDDADLDLAASMMEALNLPSGEVSQTEDYGSTTSRHHRQRGVIAGNGVNNNDKGPNFGGIIHVNHKTGGGYLYDDPLGGNNHQFSINDETDDTTETTNDVSEGFDSIDDKDVPVMDLFVGNFNNDTGGDTGWANFDDAFGASKEDDVDGSNPFNAVDFSSGEDLFAAVEDITDVTAEQQEDAAVEDLFSSVSPEDDLFAVDSSTSIQFVDTISEINGTNNGDELAQSTVKNTELDHNI